MRRRQDNAVVERRLELGPHRRQHVLARRRVDLFCEGFEGGFGREEVLTNFGNGARFGKPSTHRLLGYVKAPCNICLLDSLGGERQGERLHRRLADLPRLSGQARRSGDPAPPIVAPS